MNIYGVGTEFMKFFQNTKSYWSDIRLFDSDINKIGTMICGLKVESPEALEDLPNGDLVAVASRKFYQEIVARVFEINPSLECRPLLLMPSIGYCNMCGKEVPFWYRCGEENLTNHEHIIGAGIRFGDCPVCGSGDRERWVDFVLRNFTDIYSGHHHNVLHFAPETGIRSRFMRSPGLAYYTCDLMSRSVEFKVDITDIPFDTNKFDYIIANHVLEHVQDEAQAMRELQRCLSSEGRLVLSFPIATDADTYEDFSIVSEYARRRAFGQKDHVRLYGSDYRERLEDYGWQVEVFVPQEILQPEIIQRLCLISDDVVIVCRHRRLTK